VPVPSSVLPFMKLTEPVGVVVPEPFTVAVNVSVCPVAIEVPDAAKLVVVDCAAAVIVTVMVFELLPRDAVFPAY